MGDADVVVVSGGIELAGELAAELGIVSVAGADDGGGGGLADMGGAVLTGAGEGAGEHAASSAALAKGAISIKRRRVA
jgi:hypothetical protein